MGTPESFGIWLKRERKRRRLTQQQLAQQVTYSADQVRKIEADERRFGEAQAQLLAEFLSVPLAEHDAFIAWARGGTRPAQLSLGVLALLPADQQTTQDGERVAKQQPDTGDNTPARAADKPLQPHAGTTQATSSSRSRWLWVMSGIAAVVVITSLVLVLQHRGRADATGPVVPGGRWLSPEQHFSVRGNTLHFAARAYQARSDYPTIAYVNFTVSWLGPNGDWQIACRVMTPVAGTADQYACDWNLAAANVPDGPIRVSFDVYDAKGNYNMAPNGIHEGTMQR